MSNSSPSTDDTNRRAYELWEKNGSPHGRSDEFWLMAERELRGVTNDTVKRTPVPTAKTGFSATASRDIDTLSRKTDELLRNSGEVDNRSPTALNLDRS